MVAWEYLAGCTNGLVDKYFDMLVVNKKIG